MRQFVFGLALLAASVWAQTARAPLDLSPYPARDTHQGVTIAAVPVPDTPAAEALFGKNAAPTRAGFLPVEVIITNDRADTIEVALEPILIVAGEEKFEQAAPDEIAWALYPPPKGKKPPDPTRVEVRVPKDKNREKREEARAALRQAELRAARVAPGAYARGYLYFDLRGKSIELKESSLYVPEVKVQPAGEALLYFEISFAPYARPAP